MIIVGGTTIVGGRPPGVRLVLEPNEGVTIANRFTLVSHIASGGMSSVWKAVDDKLRRDVAVKLLLDRFGGSDDIRKRFEREAMAVAQLSCPNVVQIFDYGLEDDTPFIVMEMLEGEDLRVRLKRERQLPVDQVADILWQTSKALGVAHGEGIIHRDLKPGNIFLVEQGHDELVKVLDFGVAKTRMAGEEEKKRAGRALMGKPLHRMNVTDQTKAGTILGTPHYMSPEQILGQVDIDHRADLWSLGVIIYRALVGRLPFNLKNAAVVMKLILTTPPPPPTELAPHLPHDIDGFFAKALAEDRDDRFSSADEMARAFAPFASAALPSLRLPIPRAPRSFASHPGLDSTPTPGSLPSLSQPDSLPLTPPPVERPVGAKSDEAETLVVPPAPSESPSLDSSETTMASAAPPRERSALGWVIGAAVVVAVGVGVAFSLSQGMTAAESGGRSPAATEPATTSSAEESASAEEPQTPPATSSSAEAAPSPSASPTSEARAGVAPSAAPAPERPSPARPWRKPPTKHPQPKGEPGGEDLLEERL